MIFSSSFFCKITVQPLLKFNSFLGKNKACSVSDYYTLFAERQVRLKSRVGRNWKLNFLMVCSLVNASVISILLAILNLFWVRLYSAAGCPCIFFFHLSEILSNYLPLRIESLSPSYNLLFIYFGLWYRFGFRPF